MSAQHTPGPWSVHVEQEHNQGRTKSVYICTGDGWPESQLARVNAADGLYEREANARLIAEAPAMLEALRKIHEIAMPGQEMDIGSAIDALCDCWNESRAILARIEGAKA